MVSPPVKGGRGTQLREACPLSRPRESAQWPRLSSDQGTNTIWPIPDGTAGGTGFGLASGTQHRRLAPSFRFALSFTLLNKKIPARRCLALGGQTSRSAALPKGCGSGPPGILGPGLVGTDHCTRASRLSKPGGPPIGPRDLIPVDRAFPAMDGSCSAPTSRR